MSEGPFLDAFYELDDGEIAPITIQPETAALNIDGAGTNTVPAGPATFSTFASVGGGRRKRGLNARLVYIRITGAGTSGLTVGSRIALPWLQFSSFNSIRKRQTCTYRGGATGVVTGKSAQTGI